MDIVKQCIAGESAAYKRLYDLYNKAMYNICLRITNDPDEAEDVLQEAFVNAFSNLSSFRAESSFGAWLKRIVVNKAVNHMNKKKLPTSSLEDYHFPEEVSNETVGSTGIDVKMEVKAIKEAMNQLPDGYRMVFSLYLFEGYDHSEIAQILNISESTSKSQFNRAKKKLREIMQELWKKR